MIPIVCMGCQKEFMIYPCELPTKKFCSRACHHSKPEFATNFKHGENYRRTWVNGKREYVHRLIAGAEAGQVVHHKNGNKHDNRLENLEVMTRAEHGREHFPKGSLVGVHCED